MQENEGRPSYRVLSMRTIVLSAVGPVLVGAGLAVWLILAYGSGGEADRARLDALRTAGTIVVGTGGAAALWLAARRQRTGEIALKQKDLDQLHAERSLAATENDAAERRVTDLYTKAVEQVGSDKAAVRLGGMYALERLAQNVPGQRQVVVNVLCAYLRMTTTGFAGRSAGPATPSPAARPARVVLAKHRPRPHRRHAHWVRPVRCPGAYGPLHRC